MMEYPVTYDPKTKTWITIKGETTSWNEAFQQVKDKLTTPC